ncbi:MAG: hypothetical protein IKY16_04145 [Bacteroidales bacterium]|nr:hypothetical protein [Bacteroidales bacterium]
MNKRYTCFVIAPIGDTGSQIRRDSDDLIDLIIESALEVFNIEVIRGDHRNESGKIDADVIKLVQESDICIVDLSYENVNVYYELGRRDESGKPIILIKSVSSPKLPIDVATRRYIEYNMDDRRAIVETRKKIQEAVQTFMDMGMQKTTGTSLFAIGEKIDKIERIVSRLNESFLKANTSITSLNAEENLDAEDPSTLFRVALLERNVPKAEFAMTKLQHTMDRTAFYDIVVEQIAAIGSRKAGEMLLDNIDNFMDSVNDIKKKLDYLGAVITYLNRTDQEYEYRQVIEQVSYDLLNNEDSNNDITASIYNQLNRLYYGIYIQRKEDLYLDNAIEALQKAIDLQPNNGTFHYNMALCYVLKKEITEDLDQIEEINNTACEYIKTALELDGEEYDEDHLILACRLYFSTNNSEWLNIYELLKKISPNRAKLLYMELK